MPVWLYQPTGARRADSADNALKPCRTAEPAGNRTSRPFLMGLVACMRGWVISSARKRDGAWRGRVIEVSGGRRVWGSSSKAARVGPSGAARKGCRSIRSSSGCGSCSRACADTRAARGCWSSSPFRYGSCRPTGSAMPGFRRPATPAHLLAVKAAVRPTGLPNGSTPPSSGRPGCRTNTVNSQEGVTLHG